MPPALQPRSYTERSDGSQKTSVFSPKIPMSNNLKEKDNHIPSGLPDI